MGLLVVAVDIPNVFDRVRQSGLLLKLKSSEFPGSFFGLVSCFLSNRRIWVVLHGTSSQEHPVNGGVPQPSILGPIL